MNASKLALTALLAIAILSAFASVAFALPLTVDRVEIDDIEIKENQVNRLDLERGNRYEVEVRFTPQQDLDDVEVQVFVSGFEYNDVDRAFDVTPTFDADANVTYVKRLNVRFSDLFEEDDYKLRLIISDRNGDEIIKNYNLKIDVPRHKIKIDDVIFSPANRVRAGSALLGVVRVRNQGEKDEDDVKVTVSIPQLGVSASDFIEEVENDDDEEETEELFLRIPRCTEAGVYDVNIDVEYDNGFRRASETTQIEVLADETCEKAGDAQSKTTISIGSQLQTITQGGSAVYPITITNNGRTSKSYSLSVSGDKWATISVTPTSNMVLDGGQTATMYVTVQADDDAPEGAQVLTATISSGNKALEQVQLTANIAKKSSGIRGFLEVALVVLVVVLIILGLIIGFSRLRRDEEEPSQPQAYY